MYETPSYFTENVYIYMDSDCMDATALHSRYAASQLCVWAKVAPIMWGRVLPPSIHNITRLLSIVHYMRIRICLYVYGATVNIFHVYSRRGATRERGQRTSPSG